MKRVLISTLGESPPVVTEALDILKSEGKKIDQVVLLTTIDSHTEESANLLIKHIFKIYQGTNIYPISIEAYGDIDSEKALLDFMIKACGVLRDNIKRENEVFVSIAGGRKTMSALMMLAVQIYGAKELFHIIVDDPELEERSRITQLRKFSEREQNEILHPDLRKIKIVRMPFIGLFPWIGDIVKILKGGQTDKKEIRELLVSNKLIENNKPTQLGESFLKILEQVESRPEPCDKELIIRLDRSEPKFKKEIQQITRKLKDRFSYMCEIRDIGWREGEPKVKVEPPDKLKIFFKSRKGFNLSLLLTTTAKTSGQLEVAKKEVEEFMKREA
jgi:CRISPR-associated protein Csx14